LSSRHRTGISSLSNAPNTSITGGAAQVRILQGVGGLSKAELRFDYAKAPIPTLAYFSDYCDVKQLRRGLVFIFGKLNGTGTGLRTQVEIAFPQQLFNQQLWASTVALQVVLNASLGVGTTEQTPRLGDSEKIQNFAANNAFLASGEEEALIDFYYLSPRGIYLANTSSSGIDFEPVIRVSMDAMLLKEFFERCKPFVKETQKDATNEQSTVGS
jgi:hypothetical protein